MKVEYIKVTNNIFIMTHSILFLLMALTMAKISPLDDSRLDKEFDIFTQNIEINDVKSRSLEMRSNTNEYAIKLVPTEVGHVAFSLMDIRYRGTAKIPNLLFKIQVIGYSDGEETTPVFLLDQDNKNAIVENNNIIFKHIQGGIPVWFKNDVDSVKINYSNSHGYDLDQYLYLDDLRVMPKVDIVPNPETKIESKSDKIMIAVDGSSSVDRKDRKYIYKQLRDILSTIKASNRDSVIQIVDYGSEIYVEEIIGVDRKGKRTMRKIIKRKVSSDEIRYTNWSAPLMKARNEKPEMLILFTDGWSNYFGGKVTGFSSHFAELISLCNEVKKGGTRIVFVTTDIMQRNSQDEVSFPQLAILENLLNANGTHVWDRETKTGYHISKDVDLVVLENFSQLTDINIELPMSEYNEEFDLEQEDYPIAGK